MLEIVNHVNNLFNYLYWLQANRYLIEQNSLKNKKE